MSGGKERIPVKKTGKQDRKEMSAPGRERFNCRAGHRDERNEFDSRPTDNNRNH